MLNWICCQNKKKKTLNSYAAFMISLWSWRTSLPRLKITCSSTSCFASVFCPCFSHNSSQLHALFYAAQPHTLFLPVLCALLCKHSPSFMPCFVCFCFISCLVLCFCSKICFIFAQIYFVFSSILLCFLWHVLLHFSCYFSFSILCPATSNTSNRCSL